jgi:hypothetical protein
VDADPTVGRGVAQGVVEQVAHEPLHQDGHSTGGAEVGLRLAPGRSRARRDGIARSTH